MKAFSNTFKKIKSQTSLKQVELAFLGLLKLKGTIKNLEKLYIIAQKEFQQPCVLIIPSKEVGVDAIPANFEALSKNNNDYNGIENYEKNKNTEYIPCYLFSIDISRSIEELPEDFEFRLIQVENKKC